MKAGIVWSINIYYLNFAYYLGNNAVYIALCSI